jgi:hypothetical protein
MFFGGRSYPDGPLIGVTDADVTLDNDGLDCATRGTDVAPAASAAAKRQVNDFRHDINSLRFNSLKKTTDKANLNPQFPP